MAESTAKEIWASIPGWEGQYEVSTHGGIRSVDRWVYTRNGKTQRRQGVVLRPARRKKHLWVRLGRDGKFELVHPLVLEAFVGPRPPGMVACHWNDDGHDNRIENLRWATPSENMYDRIRNGRHKQSNQTTCARGHLLAAPNLVPSHLRGGRRNCLACLRAHGLIRGRIRLGHPDIPDFTELADRYYGEIMQDGEPGTFRLPRGKRGPYGPRKKADHPKAS